MLLLYADVHGHHHLTHTVRGYARTDVPLMVIKERLIMPVTKRSNYPFKNMVVGQSFTLPVGWDMQHARVSASEYGRRHNAVFTCRMQEDGSMRIYRVALSQQDIDRRGRNSMRVIPSTEILTLANANVPTEDQFKQWLGTLTPGSHYDMPISYSTVYQRMASWVVSYGLEHGVPYSTSLTASGLLRIAR